MRRVIDRIRSKVRGGRYILSFHAIDEMAAEGLTEEEIEESFWPVELSGAKQIGLEEASTQLKVEPMQGGGSEPFVGSRIRVSKL